MLREEFGLVCASLRQDIIDPETGRSWSQTDLANACNLSIKIVGQIERGEKVNLDSETLLRFASVFQLTTVERNRFFSLATNIDRDNLVRADQSFKIARESAISKMETFQSPVLLHDGFYRILAINSAYANVYGLTQTYLDSIDGGDPTKYHIARHIHDPSSPVREVYASKIKATEVNNVNYWRYLALGHRHSELYDQIQTWLVEAYPKFEFLWNELLHSDGENEQTDLLRGFEHNHPHLGNLKYNVVATQLFSAEDELFLTLLVPMDRQTYTVFNSLVEDIEFRLHVFNDIPKRSA